MEPDTSWIENFEETDQGYADLYRLKPNQVEVRSLYIDRNNTLISGKKDIVPLEDGHLSKKALVDILHRFRRVGKRKYRPSALLKYDMVLSPNEIESYLLDDISPDFLTVRSEVSDMDWWDSIAIFHSVNCLYIIFHETWDSGHRCTKKIRIRHTNIGRRKTKKKALRER